MRENPQITGDFIGTQDIQDGHVYISCKGSSEGDFSIEGTSFTEFEVNKGIEQEQTEWTVRKKEVSFENKFNQFNWQGGSENIVTPQEGEEFKYPIRFYNNSNTEYKPSSLELLQEFEYDLVRIDGAELDLDWDVFVDWDFDDMESEGHHPIQLKLIIYNLEKAYGELCLTVTHIESGKQIQRVLNVLSQEETPNQRKCQVQSQRSGQVLSQQQVN